MNKSIIFYAIIGTTTIDGVLSYLTTVFRKKVRENCSDTI